MRREWLNAAKAAPSAASGAAELAEQWMADRFGDWHSYRLPYRPYYRPTADDAAGRCFAPSVSPCNAVTNPNSHISLLVRGGNYFSTSERPALRNVSFFVIWFSIKYNALTYKYIALRQAKFHIKKRVFTIAILYFSSDYQKKMRNFALQQFIFALHRFINVLVCV